MSETNIGLLKRLEAEATAPSYFVSDKCERVCFEEAGAVFTIGEFDSPEDAILFCAMRSALPLLIRVAEAAQRHVDSESNATFQPLQEVLAEFNAAKIGGTNA